MSRERGGEKKKPLPEKRMTGKKPMLIKKWQKRKFGMFRVTRRNANKTERRKKSTPWGA